MKKGQMPGQYNIHGLKAMRLGCPVQEKIALGAINSAAWTAPVLMEKTQFIIVLSKKKRACRLPHAAAETGPMESQP